jgi:hypothetical protein
MDGAANAGVSSTAADVAGHGFVDIFVGGLGVLLEEHGGAHDLSGLAITALWDVDFNPGALQGMSEIVRKAFDRGDVLSGNARERSNAGTNGVSIEMDGTGSAERHAATKFCAS